MNIAVPWATTTGRPLQVITVGNRVSWSEITSIFPWLGQNSVQRIGSGASFSLPRGGLNKGRSFTTGYTSKPEALFRRSSMVFLDIRVPFAHDRPEWLENARQLVGPCPQARGNRPDQRAGYGT